MIHAVNRWISDFHSWDVSWGYPLTRRRANGDVDVRLFRSALRVESDQAACKRGGPYICTETTYAPAEITLRSKWLQAYKATGADTVVMDTWKGLTPEGRAVYLAQDGYGGRPRACGRGPIMALLPVPGTKIYWNSRYDFRKLQRDSREDTDEFRAVCVGLKQRHVP